VAAGATAHLGHRSGAATAHRLDQVGTTALLGDGIVVEPGKARGSSLRSGSGYRQENVRENRCTTLRASCARTPGTVRGEERARARSRAGKGTKSGTLGNRRRTTRVTCFVWWKGRDSNPRPRHYEVRRREERRAVTTSCVVRRSAFGRLWPDVFHGCSLRGHKKWHTGLCNSGAGHCDPTVHSPRGAWMLSGEV